MTTLPLNPTFTVRAHGAELTFTSVCHTLAEAYKIVAAKDNASDFVRVLLKAARARTLTEQQVAWLHKIATDDVRGSVPVADLNLKAIVTMLDRAAEAQKRAPRIVLSIFRDGAPLQVVLKRAGAHAKAPGTVVVNAGAYGGLYFGRVDRTGAVTRGRAWCPEVDRLLRALAADPLAVAQQHGVATGECCFCNRPLSTKESRSAGYGPICAEKFGLAWGSTRAADAADLEAKALATHFANEAATRKETI